MPFAEIIGRSFGHYRIVELVGAGGMGEVYRARDMLLERDVAIKILPAATDADPVARARLLHEARTASQLNHPNICTIYDVGDSDGHAFIAMELIEGESLGAMIRKRPLAVELIVRYGVQLADALANAHQHGVVHRDLKSANVMITTDGRVKVLDFGLAKRTIEIAPDAVTGTISRLSLTQPGTVIGTPCYMAPEQLRGQPADARSDLWALGVVLYEMAAGGRPFQRNTEVELLSAILNDPPAALPTAVPLPVRAVVSRCLEKDPDRRCQHAGEVRAALDIMRNRRTRPSGWRHVIVAAAVVGCATVALALWQFQAAKVRWARQQALPQIEELANNNRFFAAYQVAIAAQRYLPGDPALEKLWTRICRTVDVTTDPEGADLFISSYSGTENVPLGRSPLRRVRVPRLLPRWRIEKPGYNTAEGLFAQTGESMHITLDATGTAPPDMVRVRGGEFTLDMPHLGPQPSVTLTDYWIDKYEVTNREYKKFVEAGGYVDRKYWTQPFVQNDRQLAFAQAMELLRDRTGRPGPATWEAGDYPEGRADYPVSGVSWYEAAAYAEFTGKSLPTVFHWARAGGLSQTPVVVPYSNFAGKALGVAGRYRGISDVGAYDMAGNAKEWCFNGNGDQRFILGGAWNEPTYMFAGPDAQFPFARSDSFGFRLAKYLHAADASLTRPLDYPRRDFTKETPVGDAAFSVIRGLYVYDPSALRASVERVDESDEYWRKEKVSFDAAYGGERVAAYVFLPRRGKPPYQTVVYFPGGSGIELRSSSDLQPPLDGTIIKSGRAFVFPIYKGTYERGDALRTDYPAETTLYREHVFAWYKDLARTLDYVKSRADLDASRVAYYGFSWGARLGPLVLAVEPRLKTGILLNGGLKFAKTFPELDPFNFAPRVTVPVLMVNGRFDFYFPLETSQVPLFQLLGTPMKDKQHVVLDAPHGLPPVAPVAKEILNWLDRYLGPVR